MLLRSFSQHARSEKKGSKCLQKSFHMIRLQVPNIGVIVAIICSTLLYKSQYKSYHVCICLQIFLVKDIISKHLWNLIFRSVCIRWISKISVSLLFQMFKDFFFWTTEFKTLVGLYFICILLYEQSLQGFMFHNVFKCFQDVCLKKKSSELF